MLRVPLIKNPVRGFDCSHYDASIDFAQTKAAGFKFCYAKATEGTTGIDGRYAPNRQAAYAADVLFGAYHFFHPDVDAVTQASHFLLTAQLKAGDLIPVLDWEITHDDASAEIAAAKTFLSIIEQVIGKKPVIYGSPYMLNDFGLSAEFKEYPLWIAHYTAGAPLIPAPWDYCTFHQYTDMGVVPGIPATDEDMDFFNGSLENLQKMVI